MPTNIWAFSVTCTAGSTVASGAMATMNVGNDPVTQVRWRVPGGPRGTLEWWLGQSGAIIFPNGAGAGVIADDEWDTWVLDQAPANPNWQLFCVNTGTDNHVVQLQFFTDSAASGVVTTGVVLTGFPASEADIPTAWLS